MCHYLFSGCHCRSGVIGACPHGAVIGSHPSTLVDRRLAAIDKLVGNFFHLSPKNPVLGVAQSYQFLCMKFEFQMQTRFAVRNESFPFFGRRVPLPTNFVWVSRVLLLLWRTQRVASSQRWTTRPVKLSRVSSSNPWNHEPLKVRNAFSGRAHR